MMFMQYKKLLETRGITELERGQSVADAVKATGGDPSPEEMLKVDIMVIHHYIDEAKEAREKCEKLGAENGRLWEDSNKLRALEAAGVDNWEGYDVAMDMMSED
jgi:hypothetical protein